MSKFIKPEYNSDLDPVSYYNLYKIEHCIFMWTKWESVINIVEDEPLTLKTQLNGESTIVKFKFINGYIKIPENTLSKLQPNFDYTPFMILTKLRFTGNHYAAYTWVNSTFLNAHIPYIRVGVNYFKKIKKPDRYSIERLELKRWAKEELKEDHTKGILKHIPKYDDFILDPNNKNYQPIINSMYNMYHEFSHTPEKGKWIWTKRILQHVFQEHYELGLQYLQVLYLYPKQVLPILVLASKVRSTGKSTFLDWMSILFGSNMVIINPSDITSQFNSSYATSNIIGVEETVTDKSSTVEKLKALSTTKFLNLNQKYIDNTKIPFFAKFIVTTNDEKKFMRIDDEEIRFWVRILGVPEFKNTKIDMDLVSEIPAFLAHLETLPKPDFTKSRMVFTPEQINTTALKIVKEESRSWLYKDLIELFEKYFIEYSKDELVVHPTDIKNMFFKNAAQPQISYIRKVLVEEFGLKTTVKYYQPHNSTNNISARVFTINRKRIIETEETRIKDEPAPY